MSSMRTLAIAGMAAAALSGPAYEGIISPYRGDRQAILLRKQAKIAREIASGRRRVKGRPAKKGRKR